jgi:hypothetical protein
MAKLTLNTIGSRYGSIDALNANNDLVEAALENTLSRDGTGPNNMEVALDMDSNRVINMADGVGNQDAATIKQVNSIIASLSTGIIASLKERQDATAGQTVFTLAAIEYFPGSNNLAVYINGVRQYSGESYTETNSTTVTFSSGLNVGAEVLFITNEAVDNANLQASAVQYNPLGTGAISTTVEAKLRDFVSVDNYTTVSQAALGAYQSNAQMHIENGDIVVLPCNPTAGDDLQAMCKWISANHYRSEPQTTSDGNTPSTALYLEIADGLHDVTTFIDITDGRILDIRGTDTPDFRTITGATFTSLSTDARAGTLYSATITLSTALPDRVVAGFAVGGQNVQGDGGADCLNGGFIVESVATDKLSLVVKFRNHGVAPTTFTTPDSTPSLSLTPNQLLIPKATIRAQASGWGTGASREGFMNAINGGKIRMRNLGISYNGITSSHDLVAAFGEGSEIRFEDRVVLAGAGEYVIRSGYDASIYANRSCFGGGIYARSIANCSGGTNAFVRSMLGSAWEACCIVLLNGNTDFIQSVGNNCSVGMRTTYPTASINSTTSRLSRFGNAVQVNQGNIFLDTGSSIKYSTTPVALNGNATVSGSFSVANNTNRVVTSYEYNSNGGVYLPSSSRAKDPQLNNILVVTKAFTTGDLGTIAANGTLDLASTATATSTSYYWLNSNDDVLVTRSGTSMFQAGLVFQAYVTTVSTQGTYIASGTTTVTVTMANSFSPGDSVPLQFLLNIGSTIVNGTYTVVSATATEFTFTHGTAVSGEGRASRNNGVITTRINNLTATSFTPTAVTTRFAILRIVTP